MSESTAKKGSPISTPVPQAKVKLLLDILDTLGSQPSGPIYLGTHKQLAEYCLSSGNEEQAIFHLCESHGATLRNVTCNKLHRFLRKEKEQRSDLRMMRDTLTFTGEWSNDVSGLHKRLSNLPKEWTAVQLTLQWDPLSRFPPRDRNVSRGQGLFLTRLSLGELPPKTDNLQGCVFLPVAYDVNEEGLSLMAAMRETLSLMKDRGQTNRRVVHDECSLRIEAIVQDMEKWVGGWHFLFLGRLTNEKLMSDISSAVESHINAYFSNTKISADLSQDKSKMFKNVISKQCTPEKVMNWLNLVASNPYMLPAQIFEVLLRLLESQDFALYLSKKIQSVTNSHKNALLQSKRHPVILIIDEDLDILPFEIMSNLESQSFTRVPSIHFLHALYSIHKNTIEKGINLERGFYLINPSKNLPQLESMFESVSCIPSVKKWKGMKNTEPSHQEILSGLEESNIFLYCGHGGGNQYLPKDYIEKTRINVVALLFGCCSGSLDQLGGRVEMSSLSYSYLIAGSPCVVGMLWQVLDNDVNAMTKELLSVWCGSDAVMTTGGKIPRVDLSEAVHRARKCASRFLNKAAIVIRGLPVSAVCI